MIIGTIIDVSNSVASAGSSNVNGGSSIIFYTESEAVAWCQLVSIRLDYEAGDTLIPSTVMVNTSNGNRRWFKNGEEFTG